jgi:cell division septum initiation protein DivIVA
VAAQAEVAAAHDEAARIRGEAQAAADEVRRRARADAQQVVGEAYGASRRVLREGGELSDQLEQLSASLHRNAERLLADVATAHRAMVRELDAAAPEGTAAAGDLDVPEFVPRR